MHNNLRTITYGIMKQGTVWSITDTQAYSEIRNGLSCFAAPCDILTARTHSPALGYSNNTVRPSNDDYNICVDFVESLELPCVYDSANSYNRNCKYNTINRKTI